MPDHIAEESLQHSILVTRKKDLECEKKINAKTLVVSSLGMFVVLCCTYWDGSSIIVE